MQIFGVSAERLFGGPYVFCSSMSPRPASWSAGIEHQNGDKDESSASVRARL